MCPLKKYAKYVIFKVLLNASLLYFIIIIIFFFADGT